VSVALFIGRSRRSLSRYAAWPSLLADYSGSPGWHQPPV